MGLTYYHANKSGTGSLGGLSSNSKLGQLFFTIIRQNAWNEATRTGSFKGEKLNVMFGHLEVGAMMDAIDRNVEYKTYHTTPKQTLSIMFSPYVKDNVQKGFYLNVLKKDPATAQESKFSIGFSFAELKVLYEYFRFFLHRHFAAIYAADKEDFKERQEKKAKVASSTTAPDVSTTTQETTPSGDDIF
jgi:hypothetical protein